MATQRPALRERRLSRVRFEGEERSSIPIDTPANIQPLRLARGSDATQEEYFNHTDHDAAQRAQAIPASHFQPNGRFDETRAEVSPRTVIAEPSVAAMQQTNSPVRTAAQQPESDDTRYARQHGYASHKDYQPHTDVFASPRMVNRFMEMESGPRRASLPTYAGYAAKGADRGTHSLVESRHINLPPHAHVRDTSMIAGTGHGLSTGPFAPQLMETGSPRYNPAPEYALHPSKGDITVPIQMSNKATPLKPALRRTQTEQETLDVTRDAVNMVHHITSGMRKRGAKGEPDEMDTARATGVLSSLLQLYGSSTSMRKSDSAQSKAGEPDYGWDEKKDAPGYGKPPLDRFNSATSCATSFCEDDLDDHDPRLRKKHDDDNESLAPVGSRTRRYSMGADDDAGSVRSATSLRKVFKRTKSFVRDESAVYSDLTGKRQGSELPAPKDSVAAAKNIAGENLL